MEKQSSGEISIIRHFSMLTVKVPPAELIAFRDHLTFTWREFDGGKYRGQPEECFLEDPARNLIVRAGLLKRLVKFARGRGLEVRYSDLSERRMQELGKSADTYAVDWSRLAGTEFRVGQREALEAIAKHSGGLIKCPTGWGKSWTIGKIPLLFPKAKILVLTGSIQVLETAIYPDLLESYPMAAKISGTSRATRSTFKRRVIACSSGSIHRVDPDWPDIIVVDEVHEAAADEISKQLGRYSRPRFWGLSASLNMRPDNKDYRLMCLFGPIRLDVSYLEAVKDGLVVPIRVLWSNVRLASNPAEFARDTVERNRLGIWNNAARNKIIAADARKYGPDVQVLVTCSTVEHVLNLKRELPEFTVAYAESGIKPSDLAYYARKGLLPDDYEPMTRQKRAATAADFSSGKLKKVIVNSIFNRGVSFNSLQVLIRTDGGSSAINDVQIPGRTSRIDGTKEYGILHDYCDQFDDSLRRRADSRKRSYADFGWENVLPDGPPGLFA